MHPVAALAATAAIATLSVKGLTVLKKKLAKAPDHVLWLKKRRSERVDGVTLDLACDAATGVYGLEGEGEGKGS